MIYLESHNTNSDFNLALEQYVFDSMPKNDSYFMLWQNSPSIIIGKYQNTLEEINAAYVKDHNIRITRRLSGGGAVYHDLGNINYTYIVDGAVGDKMDMAAFCDPLIKTLKTIGIQAELTGRNDITIDGKKFSGNAQYSRNGRIMHHGTIMFGSDLTVLGQALNVSRDKIESKGIKSVRSRVTNIREHMEQPIEIEEFWKILRENMCLGDQVKTYELTSQDLEKVEQIRKDRYGTWEWNWGNSPACSIRKERRIEGCGKIQVFMQVKNGCIEDCQFFGDFFGEGATDQLLNVLRGLPLKEDSIREALGHVEIGRCFHHLSADQLTEILLQ